MKDDKPIEEKKAPVKSLGDDLRAQLVDAVKKGEFKKAARLRESLKNLK